MILVLLLIGAAYTLDEVNEKTKSFRESAMKPPPPALDSSSAIDVSCYNTLSQIISD